MPIQGLRTTANFVTNQRPESWREAVLTQYPNGMAPLTALTNLMKTETVNDPVFHWWQKSLDARRLQIGAAMTDVATTITITSAFQSALIAKAGDLFLIEATGEVVRVSADPTVATALVVARAQAGTTATANDVTVAGTNFYMTLIGSAYEEGSLAPTGVNYDPNEVFNYTQIFRNTLEATRTAMKTKLRTGDAIKEAKRECFELHQIDIERAFWFGKRSTGTLNGKPLRTTAGVEAQIIAGAPGNVVAAPAGGLIDYDWLETNLELAFRHGSSEKMAFGSNVALMAINQVARKNTTWNIVTGEKEFGMRITRITSPFGDIVFKTHPLFNQMRGGDNGGTLFDAKANNIYVLDMGQFTYRPFAGDDMRYEKDLTAIGLDGQKSGYLTEAGIELHHPETHMIFTGVRGGTADS